MLQNTLRNQGQRIDHRVRFLPVRLSAEFTTYWNRLDLYNEVWSQPLVMLSRKYGISDDRLGKVCRKLKIPHPGRGYWARRAVGQKVEQVSLPDFEDAPVVKRLNRKLKPKRAEPK
jgi:hypothetical protein